MRSLILVAVVCTALSIVAPSQVFTTLVNFNGTNNGSLPVAPLVQGADGDLYGTTAYGGTHGSGTVFKMTPDGALTTLYSFCSDQNCADGELPFGGLVQANDGNFYGTTIEGGTNNIGTVFRVTPGGTLTPLHSFSPAEGYQTNSALIQASDGNLYGTNPLGGANGGGTIFRVTLDGSLTVLYSFCAQSGCADGNAPQAPLLQASDGNFYGTTNSGGPNCVSKGDCGTIFKITPQGVLTSLYNFCSQPSCADGSLSYGGLVQAHDGNFYGATYGGGAKGYGTVFKVTPQGALTTLHSFSGQDGVFPVGGLVEAVEHNLYGTTYEGGANWPDSSSGGTIFRITPDGSLTVLHSFNGDDGTLISAGLVQSKDLAFYGTAANGGTGAGGTAFRLVAYAPLSVAKSGMGTVISGDGHIYCGSACSYTYLAGAKVGLTAIPAPGYTFSAWVGCDNVNGSFCSVTMSSAKDVNATFDPANVTLASLTFKPNRVKGGQLSAGTLTLGAPAPPGGVGIGLSSDHPNVAHPPSMVVVPGGQTSVSFAVSTFPVKMNTLVTITATAGSSQVSGTLTVGTSFQSQTAANNGTHGLQADNSSGPANSSSGNVSSTTSGATPGTGNPGATATAGVPSSSGGKAAGAVSSGPGGPDAARSRNVRDPKTNKALEDSPE